LPTYYKILYFYVITVKTVFIALPQIITPLALGIIRGRGIIPVLKSERVVGYLGWGIIASTHL